MLGEVETPFMTDPIIRLHVGTSIQDCVVRMTGPSVFGLAPRAYILMMPSQVSYFLDTRRVNVYAAPCFEGVGWY